jgi:hypothetical protein
VKTVVLEWLQSLMEVQPRIGVVAEEAAEGWGSPDSPLDSATLLQARRVQQHTRCWCLMTQHRPPSDSSRSVAFVVHYSVE